MSVAWRRSHYDKAGPGGIGSDYINCPLSREQYDSFIEYALLAGRRSPFTNVGRGCSLTLMSSCLSKSSADAARNIQHGPMKPFGLTNPHSAAKPYAVVQLRRQMGSGTLFNIVASRPRTAASRASANLSFNSRARRGRVCSPRRPPSQHLHQCTGTAQRPCAFASSRGCVFAGQITAAKATSNRPQIGLLAGMFAAAERRGEDVVAPPLTTAHGALLSHVAGGHLESTQWMNRRRARAPISR